MFLQTQDLNGRVKKSQKGRQTLSLLVCNIYINECDELVNEIQIRVVQEGGGSILQLCRQARSMQLGFYCTMLH